MDESPSETNQEQCRKFTDNVYAATPSSGSGGGDGDNDDYEDRTDSHQTQQMESIYNYLETTGEQNTIKKVSDWVDQASTMQDAENPMECENIVQECKTEKMEGETETTGEVGTGQNPESAGDSSDPVIVKEETPGGKPETNFKIFVSNLPPGYLNSELTELFQKYGEVLECEIFAKNYAFVHMGSEEEGMKAMEELNGLDLRGCKINVKRSVQTGYNTLHAKKKEDEKRKKKFEPETGLEVGTYKIYVGNLHSDVTQEYVSTLLEPYGRTVEVEIYRNTSAFVHMETEEGGKKAIEELHGKILPESETEKPLIVSESKNPEGPTLATIKLKVTNLSTEVKADALRNMFTPYGLILKVVVARRKHGNTDGCRSAIVHLEQFGNIRSAIKELNGKEIEGSVIRVEPSFDKPEPPKPKNKPMKPSSFRPPPRPVFEKDPWSHPTYEEPPEWGMRLIPMPSEAELNKFPRSSMGRRLVTGPPPPPLMEQQLFPPNFQRGRCDSYNNYEYNNDYDEALNDGSGGGYSNSNYDESQEYNNQWNDWNDTGGGSDYAPPPSKMPRNKSWNNSKKIGGNTEMGYKFQNGKNQTGWGKHNNNTNYTNNPNKRGLFPQMPTQNQFPKVPKPKSLLASQIPQGDDTDWSSDLPITSFSQFSNNDQDFTSDELASNTLNAVPFDYAQMQRRKQNDMRNSRNFNSNVYQNSRGNARGSKTGKGRRGGGGGKGKPRHPGLGTSQQQKKSAKQTGNNAYEDESTKPGEWQPVSRFSSGQQQAASGESAYAPYYFQQNWSFSKEKQKQKPTAKQIKEAEEEQKKQYSDYLKQKPWLYQAIPGTVKKVQQ